MGDSGFNLFDRTGAPTGRVDMDTLVKRALRVAGRLAIASRDREAVAEIISAEVIGNELPPMLKMAFAVLVVQEMTVELFAPMLTALQVEHLDTDFTSQLQSRTGTIQGGRGPRNGETSPDSET